jgi:hypothetical protein
MLNTDTYTFMEMVPLIEYTPMEMQIIGKVYTQQSHNWLVVVS